MNMLLNNTFKKTSLVFTGMLVAFSVIGLFGQVQFKLDRLKDGETFQVSLISQENWKSPMNITSTAQITIKVPSNSFEVINLESLTSDVSWEYNSKSVAPMESPEFDYLSFGLSSMGTKELEYIKGVEIPLFTFKNAKACEGSVELMANNDPFKSPNSRKANVGNSITIFGAKGEAYTSNYEQKLIPCQTPTHLSVASSTSNTLLKATPKVYPNPAIDQVFVELDWLKTNTAGNFVVLDINGRELRKQAFLMKKGSNKAALNVENLPSGIFSIEFRHSDQSLVLDRFIKQSR